ncbi:MAG: hypothetical protein GVY36_08870 [Verrucomicrobia bacterium]|jgi:hypothetical protein|nr:hypothetical protein [Verrucomicrobiota bacterium]
MKNFELFLFLCAIISTPIAAAEIKTLDFSGGEHSFSVFERADVELKPFKGIRYLRTIDGGTYRILLPGNIEYLLEIERGEVRNHLEKEGYVNTLKLITRRLSLEASKKLAYTFHQQFNLDESELDEWFERLESGDAYSRYGKGGVGNHYPRMGMGLRTTFGKEQPAFAIFSVSWDESFSERWGTSIKSNRQLNVSYDMPELLEGVPEFTEVPEVEPVIVKVGQPEPVIEEKATSEPESEEAAERVVTEPIEEDVELSSNWWLWLISAVVVFGGLGLVLRRKN